MTQRTRLTTSCEVSPLGLSMMSTPFMRKFRLLLYLIPYVSSPRRPARFQHALRDVLPNRRQPADLFFRMATGLAESRAVECAPDAVRCSTSPRDWSTDGHPSLQSGGGAAADLYINVPTRLAVARAGQHVDALDLRRQHRRLPRALPLPGFLFAERCGGKPHAHHVQRELAHAKHRRQRGDCRSDGRVFHSVSQSARADLVPTDLHLSNSRVADAWLLGRKPIFKRSGHCDCGDVADHGRHRVLGARRWVRCRDTADQVVSAETRSVSVRNVVNFLNGPRGTPCGKRHFSRIYLLGNFPFLAASPRSHFSERAGGGGDG